MKPARRAAMTLFVAAALTPWAAPAFAQPVFPNKPVKIIVGFPAGGPLDAHARLLADRLGQLLGQPVIVDYKAGAGGSVGADFVAKSDADGYTLLMANTGTMTINPAIYPKNPYQTLRDFAAVARTAMQPLAILVNPGVPATTVKELVALAKKNPGKLTYANAGNGTASHIPAEVMKAMTGTDILSVPYKGVAEATTDLMAGRIDMFFVGTQIALQHVQSGKLRALALTGSRRWKGMPDVPTMDEQGLKGFNKVNWFGLWLPAGAPPEIVQKIHAAVASAVNEPDVRQQFDTLGLEGVAMRPAEFASFVASEQKAAQEIARAINAGAKK